MKEREPMSAEQSTSEHAWTALHVLLGQWVGEEESSKGTGWFSFTPDVQEQVLVRKNHADYPATVDRPAFSHDDLMIVYRDSSAKELRAIYFDNASWPPLGLFPGEQGFADPDVRDRTARHAPCVYRLYRGTRAARAEQL